MTVEARVAAYVKSIKPVALCDSCIAQTLGLGFGANRTMARNATAGLGIGGAFSRVQNICSRCGQKRLVTRAN
jgi:hypothetical protein